MLDERERSVLETLQRLRKEDVVLIGGYAVNVYVPPRFSIDCDLVVLGNPKRIEFLLKKDGFVKTESGEGTDGGYVRYEKLPSKVSFDLLIGSVLDRETRIVFEGKLFRSYSNKRTAVGRASPLHIEITVADPELLFAMKFVSARRQDTRDLFMLAGEKLKWKLIKKLISEKCDSELMRKRAELIENRIESKDYRDSLQGPYGKIPDKTFDRCKKNLSGFLGELGNDLSIPDRTQDSHF